MGNQASSRSERSSTSSVKAVFAVDPGSQTGLAWGITRPEAAIKDELTRARTQSRTIEGSVEAQTRIIAQIWRDFMFHSLTIYNLIPDMVFEDWVHVVKPVPTTSEMILPVKIAWATIGYRLGRADTYNQAQLGPTAPVEYHFQTAAQAKTFAKNERLKLWGMYVPGKPHETDAYRHFALRIANIRQKEATKQRQKRQNEPLLPRNHP